MHALVVGVSEINHRILENSFQAFEYPDPTFVESGDDALERLEKERFGIVIVNKQLPGMAGVEFVREMRSTEKPRYNPILLIGEEFTNEDIVKAVQSGVNQVLLIPLTINELKEKIDRAWKMIG